MVRVKHTLNTLAGVALDYANAIENSKRCKSGLQWAYLEWRELNDMEGVYIERGSQEWMAMMKATTHEYAALFKAKSHERRCKAKFLAVAKGVE